MQVVASLVQRFDRAKLRQLLRYASVSAVSSITSLIILGVGVGVVGFPAVWSNVVATAIGTVPSFELNRRWVWRCGKHRPMLRQVLPFCALSLAGLVLSSLAVRVAGGLTRTAGRSVHTLAVEVASIGTYGALWLVQFVLCDRMLFPPQARSGTRATVDDAVGTEHPVDRERIAAVDDGVQDESFAIAAR